MELPCNAWQQMTIFVWQDWTVTSARIEYNQHDVSVDTAGYNQSPHSLQRYAATWRVNNSLLSRHPVQPNPATPKESCRIQRFAAQDRTARARRGEQLAKVRIDGDTALTPKRAMIRSCFGQP
jgi:hypothetical protein